MARLYSTGFELKSDIESSLVAAGAETYDTSIKRTGTTSLKLDATGGTQNWTIAYSSTDIATYIRAYIRIDTRPPSVSAQIIAVAGNSATFSINITPAGKLQLIDQGISGVQIGSDSAVLSLNTFYRVELKVNSSGSPQVEAKIDGTVFASGSFIDSSGNVSVLVIGTESGTIAHFDDVAINDTTGTSQNSYPGDGSIIYLSPNAAGDSNQWSDTSNSAGTLNNFTLVDEIPPNDATDFVQTGTLNNVDIYNVSASGLAATDLINVVQVGIRFRNNTADATTAFKPRLEKTSGGTISEGSALIPNSISWLTNNTGLALAFYPLVQYPLTTYTAPDGDGWDNGKLDSMQIGAKLTTANTNRIQITSMWAVVDYTAGSGTTTSTSVSTTSSSISTSSTSQSTSTSRSTSTSSTSSSTSVSISTSSTSASTSISTSSTSRSTSTSSTSSSTSISTSSTSASTSISSTSSSTSISTSSTSFSVSTSTSISTSTSSTSTSTTVSITTSTSSTSSSISTSSTSTSFSSSTSTSSTSTSISHSTSTSTSFSTSTSTTLPHVPDQIPRGTIRNIRCKAIIRDIKYFSRIIKRR